VGGQRDLPGAAAAEFAAFAQPGFVKIVWTLRVHFRTYWAFASPGIALIRWLSLSPLKREAEHRARDASPAATELVGVRILVVVTHVADLHCARSRFAGLCVCSLSPERRLYEALSSSDTTG